jgi:hypothetical protein
MMKMKGHPGVLKQGAVSTIEMAEAIIEKIKK